MKPLSPILLIVLILSWPAACPADSFQAKRMVMVSEQIQARGVSDAATLAAMRKVPRHEFVPKDLVDMAYHDRPLPIGHGQTISQPYIVAYMTEVLKLTGQEKVLEIGTGSGYQAAVLAVAAGEIYSVEIIPELHQSARKRLARLGYGQVYLLAGDGYFGWQEKAPFDRIIVTCAAGHIPPPLIKQLKPGGLMIIPVGRAWATQSLVLAEKDQTGQVKTRSLLAVRFVPLVRK